jgi:sec-independent protein translocase protein TatC
MPKLSDSLTGARIVGERYLHSKRRENPEGRMALIDHIRELRNRVVKALLGLGLGMVVGFIFFHREWAIIQEPFCHAVTGGCSKKGLGSANAVLVMQGVLEPFYLRVKIAFIIGFIISSPIWLYQLWGFIAPGLYAREKRWTYAFLGTSLPLFIGGVVLAYSVMGRGLHYLLGMTPGDVYNLPTVDTYLSYVTTMLLGFGIAFELPLILVVLNLVGILTHARFKKWRRVMIFAVFVFAGIASPSPDPMTMILLAVPCIALVEVAEVIVWMNDRRRVRTSPYEGLADDELAPLDLDDADETVGSGTSGSNGQRSDLN